MFKKNKSKKILIMGLPGAGKTYLAKEVYKELNAVWINGDNIRKKFKDWDFTKKGRIRQARRLNKLSNDYVRKGKNVVVDFICPNRDSFKNFKSDFVVWVDTIKKGRHIRKHLDDINPIFRKPKKYDLRVTSKDAKLWKLIIIDRLRKKKWNNKKPTAQMLGRYQPWHLGHRKLFEYIVKKDLQVNIQVKDSQGLDKKNPYSFKRIKKNIQKDLESFKSRIKITKVPNITNIFYGRKVGYKIKKILTPKKFRDISATKIRSKLKI
tara:strand:- start:12 stop:806 length:795 start_codon:yes stop_codon:yes gene_type:complete